MKRKKVVEYYKGYIDLSKYGVDKMDDLPWDTLNYLYNDHWAWLFYAKKVNDLQAIQANEYAIGIIGEAMAIKRGNEEEIWDSLT